MSQKILHILNQRGGGYKRFIDALEKRNELVWERNKSKALPFNLDNISAIVIYGYMPDFDFSVFKNQLKVYYFTGLRAVSKRMLLNKTEFNIFHLYKFFSFKKWLKKFDYFLSVSLSMSFMAKKFYNVESSVIYNGLDLTVMPTIKRERQPKLLVWVGRPAWIKGLDRFLKLMDLLTDYEGWVVGIKNRNYKNIKFLGYVEDIYKIINKSRALIITSYYEAMPYSCLEALYYGVPVLTLNSAAGAVEILQLLGKQEWCFNNIYQIADYIRNNNVEDFKRDSLFEQLFNFERSYKNLNKIIQQQLRLT